MARVRDMAEDEKEPRVVVSDMTPESKQFMAPEPEEEKGQKATAEAAAERAEIEAARREYQRIIAACVEFMRRKGYPCVVGKGKFPPPPGWDPRPTLDRCLQPYTIVVDDTNYDVDDDSFLGIPDAPCSCCHQRSPAMQQALLRQQRD